MLPCIQGRQQHTSTSTCPCVLVFIRFLPGTAGSPRLSCAVISQTWHRKTTNHRTVQCCWWQHSNTLRHTTTPSNTQQQHPSTTPRITSQDKMEAPFCTGKSGVGDQNLEGHNLHLALPSTLQAHTRAGTLRAHALCPAHSAWHTASLPWWAQAHKQHS